jgi:hypothetical protein
MRNLLKLLSFIGLLLTLFPSIFYFSGYISADMHKLLTLIGTGLWFLTAPFWMNSSEEAV